MNGNRWTMALCLLALAPVPCWPHQPARESKKPTEAELTKRIRERQSLAQVLRQKVGAAANGGDLRAAATLLTESAYTMQKRNEAQYQLVQQMSERGDYDAAVNTLGELERVAGQEVHLLTRLAGKPGPPRGGGSPVNQAAQAALKTAEKNRRLILGLRRPIEMQRGMDLVRHGHEREGLAILRALSNRGYAPATHALGQGER